MADMGVADAAEKELRRLDDEWAKCAKENTALREQLIGRERRIRKLAATEFDLREQLRETSRITRESIRRRETEIRRLTDALREIVLLQGNMMQTAGIIARRALAEMGESDD